MIGIVSPWNFPVSLSFSPIVQALAAGNRVMLKPSEFTEQTAALMAELVAHVFAAEEVAVVTGGPEVAAEFTSLPFDHLVFTGSTATGRKVMEAAARNLVPVTLELGGKSPVIVGESANLARAGDRIALGKLMNAGQVCLAPDYLLVPEGRSDAMVSALTKAASAMYPSVLANDDYTSIVQRSALHPAKGHGRGCPRQGRRSDRGQSGGRGFRRQQCPQAPAHDPAQRQR